MEWGDKMEGIKVIKKCKEYVIIEVDFPTKQLEESLNEDWMDGKIRDKVLKFGKKLFQKDATDTWETPKLFKKKTIKVKVELFTDDIYL